MKILYAYLTLWTLVASPSFVQNSVFQAENQFDTYKQARNNSSAGRKGHRGSGRRYPRNPKIISNS